MSTYQHISWHDPEARLALLERVGPVDYNRLARDHRVASVVDTEAGHDLSIVPTGFGTLIAVGDTGKAFSTIRDARIFARANPADGSDPVRHDMHVVRNNVGDYWSLDGWGDYDHALLYRADERDCIALPEGGHWEVAS